MSHGYTPFVDLLKKFPAWNFEGKTLFDAGAGYGELGFYIKTLTNPNKNDLIQVKFRGTPILIGCDINVDRVAKAGKGVYDKYFHWNLSDTPYPFLSKLPDFTVCLEVLEHIPEGKAESLRILSYLETLSPNLVIGVPNGNHLYSRYEQKHLNHYSVWHPEDFLRRGYDVQLIHLTGLAGMSRRLYELCRKIWRNSPAEHILAIKSKRGEWPWRRRNLA